MGKRKLKVLEGEWKPFLCNCNSCGNQQEILFWIKHYEKDEYGDLQQVLPIPPHDRPVWARCENCGIITRFVPLSENDLDRKPLV